MGYVLGICGIVLVGSIIFALVYSFFNKKYDLDDVGINSKEDRRYGSSELDYDYDDDDRVELFDDMVDFARKAEEEDFDRAVEEINKFVARRLPENEQGNSNVEGLVNTNVNEGFVEAVVQVNTTVSQQPVVAQPVLTPVAAQSVVDQPVLTPVVTQTPVNTPQVQPIVPQPVNNVTSQNVVVQNPVNVVSQVSPVVQQPVQSPVTPVASQPVLQKLGEEQQNLFEQIDIEGPDDYVEEL